MIVRVICTLMLIPLAVPAIAQNNPVLPDLAPRVVEITGDLTISFPSISRQPLIGFNPPPRVPEIPASQRPYTELYKQATGELPPSPLTPPQPPEASSMANREGYVGMIEAGLGRYSERLVRGNVSLPMNVQTSLTISGSYHGTDGHEPFDTVPLVQSDSDREFLSAGIGHETRGLNLGASLLINRAAYSMFGVEHGSGSALARSPNRTVFGWNLSGRIGTKAGSSVRASMELAAGRSDVETALFDTAEQMLEQAIQNESLFSATGAVAAPVASGNLALKGRFLSQKLDGPFDTENASISSGQISGQVGFSPAEGVTANAGLMLLGFDAVGQTITGGDRSLVFLSPAVDLTYVFQPGTDFTLSNKPQISSSRLWDVFTAAPFIQDGAPLQPVLTPVDLRAGLGWYNDFLHLDFGFGLKEVENYRVVESPKGIFRGFSSGYMSVSYHAASITYLDGSVTASFAPGIQAGIEAAFRRGRLDDGDADIPYFSPATFGASLSLGLSDGRFLITLAARGESARYSDRMKTTKLDGLFLVDAEGTWFMTPQAAILFGVRNLGGSTLFWEDYEMESNVIFAGAKWRW